MIWYRTNYEARLKSSWTHIITPSRNFVEVQWRSVFRSTSFGKRCTSYNAPPTSRKRAAGCWSLRNFLPRSSLFMVGKAQKSHGARSELYCGCSNGVPPIIFFQAEHIIQFRSHPMRFLSPTQPPIQWVPGVLSLGVKRPGLEADHSPPSVGDVKNARLYTSIPNTSPWRGA
jgi:hypothetical protein